MLRQGCPVAGLTPPCSSRRRSARWPSAAVAMRSSSWLDSMPYTTAPAPARASPTRRATAAVMRVRTDQEKRRLRSVATGVAAVARVVGPDAAAVVGAAVAGASVVIPGLDVVAVVVPDVVGL